MKTIYKNYIKANELNVDMDIVLKNTLNQEGLGDFINKIGNFFITKIQSIKALFGFNSKSGNTTELSKGVSVVLKELNKLDKTVKELSETDIGFMNSVKGIKVPYIPGIEVNLYQLVTGITPIVSYINNNTMKILEDVDTFIAKLSDDSDFRLSMISDKDLIKRLTIDSKVVNDYIISIMNGKLIEDFRTLEDVIPNMNSISSIHTGLKSMVGVRDLDNLKKLSNVSEEIANRVDGLYNRIKEGELNISKVKLNDMVVILKSSAQLVTDSIAAIRLVDASIKIHKHIVEKLEKIN